METRNVKEFGLVIIESLRNTDKKTGEILHNEIIKYKQFDEPNLSSYLYIVHSKQELFDVLRSIVDRIQENGLFPIIHFETHGYDDGIQLESYEIVKWDELLGCLREINIQLSNSLLILMSMCLGISIISKINPTLRAPFMSIVGSTREVNEDEILSGFEHFYNNYFFSFDLHESLSIMNNHISRKEKAFHYLTSEFCFDAICDPDRDPIHFNEMVNNQALSQKQNNRFFTDLTFEEVRDIVELDIRTASKDLHHSKNHFLMKDLLSMD